jgi:hypothetical protein
MKTYILGLIAAFGTAGFVLEMLRRGILREKFAVLWLSVSAGLLLFAAFPDLLGALARLVGIALPSNLLFMMAAVLLLLVSVQLSYEISRLEARSQRLAEEVALLRYDVGLLRKEQGDG